MAENPRRRRIRVEIGEARMDSGAAGVGGDRGSRSSADASETAATRQAGDAVTAGYREATRTPVGAVAGGSESTVRARRRRR